MTFINEYNQRITSYFYRWSTLIAIGSQQLQYMPRQQLFFAAISATSWIMKVIDGKTFTADFRTEWVELSQLSETQQGKSDTDSNDETTTENLHRKPRIPRNLWQKVLLTRRWHLCPLSPTASLLSSKNGVNSSSIIHVSYSGNQTGWIRCCSQRARKGSFMRRKVTCISQLRTKLKGKRLVILLHRSPGSGKTITAGQLRFLV